MFSLFVFHQLFLWIRGGDQLRWCRRQSQINGERSPLFRPHSTSATTFARGLLYGGYWVAIHRVGRWRIWLGWWLWRWHRIAKSAMGVGIVPDREMFIWDNQRTGKPTRNRAFPSPNFILSIIGIKTMHTLVYICLPLFQGWTPI